MSAAVEPIPGRLPRRLRWPSPGALGRWLVLALGIVGGVVAWRNASAPWYLVALVVTVVGVLCVLHGRPRWAALAVLATVLAGLGGPWLGVRLAYRPVGVQAPWHLEDYSYVSSDDAVTRLRNAYEMVALDRSGEEAWSVDLDHVLRIYPLNDGVVVVFTRDKLMAIGADGTIRWSRASSELGELVAVDGHVAVDQECRPRAADEPTTCTWTGVDTNDGTTLWELAGATSHVGVLADGVDPFTPIYHVETSLFSVGVDGSAEIRDARTGELVQRLPDNGGKSILVGDAVLVVDDAGPCSAELLRAGSAVWHTEFDCALWESGVWHNKYGVEPEGFRVGDTIWFNPTDRTFVLDLTDGAVRTEPHHFRLQVWPYGFTAQDVFPVIVLGAGVQVEARENAVVALDPADSRELWQVRVAAGDVRSIRADGGVVLIDVYSRPLLLHEWFAPDDAGLVTLQVRDARTGALRAEVRHRASSTEPNLIGDQVLVEMEGLDGHSRLRMVGG